MIGIDSLNLSDDEDDGHGLGISSCFRLFGDSFGRKTMNEEMAALLRDLTADPSDWSKVERFHSLYQRLGMRPGKRTLGQLVQGLRARKPSRTQAQLRLAGVAALPELVRVLTDPDAALVAHALELIGELGRQAQSALPFLVELFERETTVIRLGLLTTTLRLSEGALLGSDLDDYLCRLLQREWALLGQCAQSEARYHKFLRQEPTGDPMNAQEEHGYVLGRVQGQNILDHFLKHADALSPVIKKLGWSLQGLREELLKSESPLAPRLDRLIKALQGTDDSAKG